MIWGYKGIHRTISTVSIDPATGLLFVGDFSGFVHCLDAETGKVYWVYDMKAHMWGSTFVADGKVYVGDEDGDFVILPAKKDFDPKKGKPIFEVNLGAPMLSTPITANGVFYVMSQTHLYAVGGSRCHQRSTAEVGHQKVIRAAAQFSVLLFALGIADASDWPQFRGPTGLGYTEEKNLPLNWNAKSNVNIAWKAPLPKSDNPYSSPVVVRRPCVRHKRA